MDERIGAKIVKDAVVKRNVAERSRRDDDVNLEVLRIGTLLCAHFKLAEEKT